MGLIVKYMHAACILFYPTLCICEGTPPLIRSLEFESWIYRKSCWERYPQKLGSSLGFKMGTEHRMRNQFFFLKKNFMYKFERIVYVI